MNDHTDDHNNPKLHLHADPQAQEMESLLDRLAQADRDAMPADASARLMEAISGAMAPAPIAIEQAHAARDEQSMYRRVWKLRYAAAALLATGTTLAIVALRPWGASPSLPPQPSTSGNWSLASFEQDLDAYLTLEGVDDGQLTEAVTEWEIWAQAVDTEIDSSMYGDDLYTPTSDDGAL